jgi:hypothetical protein
MSPPIIAEGIETETVFSGIDFFDEVIFKYGKLREVQITLEYRVLYSLSVILTEFGNPPKSLAPG